MMSGQPGVGEEGKEFNFLKPNSIPAYLLAEKQAAESRSTTLQSAGPGWDISGITDTSTPTDPSGMWDKILENVSGAQDSSLSSSNNLILANVTKMGSEYNISRVDMPDLMKKTELNLTLGLAQGGPPPPPPPQQEIMRDYDKPISDESFMKINEVGASFCTGGFSARSTSVGGSVEVSNREQQLPFNPQQKTQDERFSDFSILRGNSSGDKPGGMSSASKHRFEDYSNVAHSKLFGDGSSGGIGLPNGSPQNFSLAGSGVLSNPFESGKRISNSDLANFKEDPFRSRDSNPFGGFQGSGDPFAKISPVPARPCTDMNSNKNPVTPTEHVGEQQRSSEDPPRLVSLGGNCVEDEEFGAVNPHELIDNDEKQFEEENRFNQTGNGGGDAVRGVGVTDLSGISPGGSSRPVRGEANESKMSVFPTDDPLSRSHYFQMNSSRLGSLDTELGSESRPLLGFPKIVSPERKMDARNSTEIKPVSDQDGASGRESQSSGSSSKNSTFTVATTMKKKPKEDKLASDVPASGEELIRLVASKMNLEPSRQDKPQEMDLASLGKAMEKVLPPQGGVDPKAHYARIQDFLRQVQAGEENRSESPLDNKTLDATSLSMFLPSFLETSMDETGALGSGGKSSAEKRAAELEEVFKVPAARDGPSPQAPKSRIPVRTPSPRPANRIPMAEPQDQVVKAAPAMNKSSRVNGINNANLSKLAEAKKKSLKAQRFSSPIKDDANPVALRSKKINLPNANDQQHAAASVRSNLFGKENQGTQVPTPSLTPSGIVKPIPREEPTGKSVSSPSTQEDGHMKLTKFPVDSDRFFVSWVSVEVGRSEDATLVLRNRLSTQLNLTLIIRESLDFRLNTSQSEKIVMAPLSTCEVVITFCPSSSSGSISKGKLIIKPILGGPGKPMRATIPLQGCVGSPKLAFTGFGDFLKENRLLNLGDLSGVERGQIVHRKMLIRNTGSATAFVKLVSFLDPGCRNPGDSVFNISPKEFLVPAGAEVGVQVQVSDLHLVELDARSASKNSFLGTIAIFHGSEMLRQAMILARRQEGAGRLSFSPNLLGIDFTDLSFANKNQFAPITYPGQVDINDLRQFNAKTQKEVVEICGKRRARSASPSRAVEFKCLHGEETLSESRLNCTVVDRSVMMQPTMGTVQELSEPAVDDESSGTRMPPPLSLPNRAQKIPISRSSSKSRHERTVYLDKTAVFFPKTQIGSKTSTKVQFKNRTESPVTLKIGATSAPFKSHPGKTEIVVKPKAFLNLPMYYCPSSKGPHETIVQFTGTNGLVLTAQLKGVTA